MIPTYRVAAANRQSDPTRTVDSWLIVKDTGGKIQATQEIFPNYQTAQQRAETLNQQLSTAQSQPLY